MTLELKCYARSVMTTYCIRSPQVGVGGVSRHIDRFLRRADRNMRSNQFVDDIQSSPEHQNNNCKVHGDWVGVVQAHQQVARWCYEDNLGVRDNKRGWRVEDAFVWSPEDMPKIDPDFLCHRLTITLGMQPVCQKKRKEGWGRREERLERKQPSCCKHYSYERLDTLDPYPLPSIDGLVDGASRCGPLSFMDTYSGYNQIIMNPSDELKTTFITNEVAIRKV
ncbi:hypothetical protein CR513_51306, partial [Mucuna pruriens]